MKRKYKSVYRRPPLSDGIFFLREGGRLYTGYENPRTGQFRPQSPRSAKQNRPVSNFVLLPCEAGSTAARQ